MMIDILHHLETQHKEILDRMRSELASAGSSGLVPTLPISAAARST